MVADKRWGKKIHEAIHFMSVGEFDGGGYEIMVTGITEPGEQWSVSDNYRTRLLKALDKANIEIV
jgi:small-conductance mechanosensitive channel